MTGELTRNFANRKLKIKDVEPNGATYSTVLRQRNISVIVMPLVPARMYSSARVLPMSWDRLCHNFSTVLTVFGRNTYMYNIMPSNHNGRNQSFLREAFGIALVLT